MAINRADITVADVGELSLVHVAELRDGANAWVVAELDYFVLQKNSGAAPSADVVQPISGSPSAGAANARWVRLGSDIPIVGRTFEAHLTSDVAIVATAPTPPFTFPAGQPTPLLVLPIVTRAGPLLIEMDCTGFVGTANVATEHQPFVQFQLWLDGAQVPGAAVSLSFTTNLPSNVVQIEAGGSLSRLIDVLAGPHTVEVRWGVQGSVPDAVGIVFAGSGADNVSLVAQEVSA